MFFYGDLICKLRRVLAPLISSFHAQGMSVNKINHINRLAV